MFKDQNGQRFLSSNVNCDIDRRRGVFSLFDYSKVFQGALIDRQT